MNVVLNDRDAALQAAGVRIVNPKNAWINLAMSAPGFHLNAAGQADLSVVTVTADLVGLDDAVTFKAVGGTLSNAAGRSVDVTYGGQAAIVTATVMSNGEKFERSCVIPVLRDGSNGSNGLNGLNGSRGAGHYYASGSAWSDGVADGATPGGNVVGDVVTISSGTYVMEKRWDGSAWVDNGVVVNGKLIAPDSILTSALSAEAVTARHLAVTGSAGALNRDPYFTDPRAWTLTNMVGGTNPGGAAPANTFVQGTAMYGTAVSERFPIDSSKSYNASVSVWASWGNNRNFRIIVNFYDGAGNILLNTGWGDQFSSGFAQTAMAGNDNTWRPFKSGGFGAKYPGRQIPAAAKFCTIAVQINANEITSTSNAMAATGLRLDEMASGVLIEPKGITAPHIDVETLSAIIAYLGNVEIGANGSLRQRARWFGDEGVFLGANANGAPVFSLVAGNRKLLFDAASSSPIQIINPDVSQAQMSISGVGNINGGSNKPNSTTSYYTYGSFEPTFLNAKEPVEVSYSFTVKEGNMRMSTYVNANGVLCASISGQGYNSANSGWLVCTAVGADNRTATKNIGCYGSHGTLP